MRFPISIVSFVALLLHADETPIISSLNDDMIETTQLANQTNQNIDYQPFILSVWEQKDLFAFGAKTLKDALMLVPGVDMTADSMNNRTTIIRGSNPLAYGQTKLAIDGVVVNDRSFDSYNAYLDFPIELIQRIEVVRGSGSFIEGVNGYSGTINVITYAKDEGNKQKNGTLFGSFGNDSARQAGFFYTHRAKDWKLSTDMFYQSQDAISPISVTDKYGNIGYAPLGSNQLGIGATYSYGDFSLKGRMNRFESGSAFGSVYALPNMDGTQSFPSWYLEGEYCHSLNDDLSFDLKVGIMQDGWESDSRALPPGTYGGITYPLGFWTDYELQNRSIYEKLSTTYTGFDKHKITFGYTHKFEKVISLSSITTETVNNGTNLVDYSDISPFLDKNNAKRTTDEFYLSDTIDLNDELALSLQIGATKASNISFHSFKRAALVYQPYRKHILKFLIGDSYRLPSWQEMYTLDNPARVGNPDLEPEHALSYETQYLYKPSADMSMGINLFYIHNTEQITSNTADHTFQNVGERNILGLESEIRGSIGDNDLTAFSYSYISGETIKGNVTTDYLPFASSHMLKGAFSYALTSEWKAGVVGRYSSIKERRPGDNRSATDAFITLNLILGWENSQGLYVQGAINNIADDIYRYPSPASTYQDDYPVEGRTYWLRTGWKF